MAGTPPWNWWRTSTPWRPSLPHWRTCEREIIELRLAQEMTQSQIGDRLGLSQMHVSRLLTRILAKFREGMLTQD